MTASLLLGANPDRTQSHLLARMANRHGLIAGATGTGKTVTLQVLAESFSRLGVPVFAADIKGDLSGLASAGKPHPKIDERIERIGIKDYSSEASPVQLWDVFAEKGLPVRATVASMGPDLLSHLLELNDTQEGILFIGFKVAEVQDLPLVDLRDLRALLHHLSEHASELSQQYGRISGSSIAAIQRRLLVLEESGGDLFFGVPALQIHDLMRLDDKGRGVINLLDGQRLMMSPRIYGTFLFWLLSELFTRLPEVGDPEKPVLVFFFDEAHLLFDSAPKALLQRIEQVVRLIRSKGVGIYFVTQNPADIPDDVLGQLGNKLQHALRAFTERDRKAVRAAAESFRENPALDTLTVIAELGVGECLVSVLDEKAVPLPVERVLMSPPRSKIGPSDAQTLSAVREASLIRAQYAETQNPDSAEERLQRRREKLAAESEKSEQAAKVAKAEAAAVARKETGSGRSSRGRSRQGFLETFFKSILRSLGSQAGRNLIRALVRALTGGRR